MITEKLNKLFKRIELLDIAIGADQISQEDALNTIHNIHDAIQDIVVAIPITDISLYETLGILTAIYEYQWGLWDLIESIGDDDLLLLKYPNRYGCGYLYDDIHVLIFARDDDFAVTVTEGGIPKLVPIGKIKKFCTHE